MVTTGMATVSPETALTLTDSILGWWEAATPAQRVQGAGWYPAARMYAEMLGPVDTAAAVIAACSPRLSWARNKLAAAAVMDGRPFPGLLGRSRMQAERARDSADPLATLTGQKVSRFARNIVGDDRVVTVDAWALRAAGIDPTIKLTQRRYTDVETAYQDAARAAGVAPSTMQATVWVAIRGKAE